MHNMTKENFQTSVSNFDISTLSEKQAQEYLNLSTIYRTLLNEYIKRLGLKQYDDFLKNSDLNFIPIDEENQDFYQYYNNSDLSYYYIRNNIYLDRLNDQEKAYLKNKMQSSNFIIDDNDMNFIATTFRKVITEIHPGVKEPFQINFGPTSSLFFARNDALVIGFRYDAFSDEISDEEFEQNYNKQVQTYTSINEQLEKQLSQQLKIPVNVIEYNENSVKKKLTEKGRVR